MIFRQQINGLSELSCKGFKMSNDQINIDITPLPCQH